MTTFSKQAPERDPQETRRRVERDSAAILREKEIPKNGKIPVSVWLMAACGLAAVTAGAIYGGAGKNHGYDLSFRDSYVRTRPPGDQEGPPPKAAMDAYLARGKKVWQSKCITCHGPDAAGQGEMYPSLVGSEWATGETERFAMIVLNGLHGPNSKGKVYGGEAGMPSQNDATAPLSAEDLAGVMTYVRNHFGNTVGDVVSVDMAKQAFAISAKREKAGKQVDGNELRQDHTKPLPGRVIEPKTMVNPLTLLPVVAAKAGESSAPATATPAPAAGATPATK